VQCVQITRTRAHQLRCRTVEVLRHRDETRELAEKLAAVGAPVVRDTEPKENMVIAVDSAPTKRDRSIAMKLVKQADRELAIAIDACRDAGDEALGAALESARSGPGWRVSTRKVRIGPPRWSAAVSQSRAGTSSANTASAEAARYRHGIKCGVLGDGEATKRLHGSGRRRT
jgi:hypothetical protein